MKFTPYISSLIAGAAASLAMVLLSLRFYVSVQHRYWTCAALALLTASLLAFANKRSFRGGSISTIVARIAGYAGMFVIGAAGTFYSLMAIYPPNFS